MEEQHLNKAFKALATFKAKISFVQNTQPIKKLGILCAMYLSKDSYI